MNQVQKMIIIRHHCRAEEAFARYCKIFCELMLAVAVAISLLIMAVLALNSYKGAKMYMDRYDTRREVYTDVYGEQDKLRADIVIAESGGGFLVGSERNSEWVVGGAGTRVLDP